MTDHVNGDKFVVWLTEDGLLRCEWVDGAVVTSADAQQALDAHAIVTGNVPAPLLVDVRPVASVERTARRIFATAPTTTRQGLIVGSPLSRTLGNFFLTISRPTMPVKLFDDEATAIAWLRDDG